MERLLINSLKRLLTQLGRAAVLCYVIVFQLSAFSKNSTSRSQSFFWQSVEGASYYVVQIASDEEFKQIVVNRKSTESTLQVENLVVGKYFLRVASVAEDGAQSEFSKTAIVEVSASQLDLIAPENNLVSDSVKTIERVSFSWSALEPKAKYEFSMSRDPDFLTSEKVEIETTTLEKPLKVDGKPYYWRVRALLENGSQSPYSLVRKLTLNFFMSAPSAEEPKNEAVLKSNSNRLATLKLKWIGVPLASKYEVQIFNDETELKTPLVSRNIEFSELEIKLPIGYYRWRVRAIAKDNRPGPFSKERSFQISGVLAPPVMVRPANKEIIREAKKSFHIDLSWAGPVEGVTTFEFQVSSDATFKKIAKSARTKRTTAKVTLVPGNYFVRVRSSASDMERSAWSKVSAFQIIEQKGWFPRNEVRLFYLYSFENLSSDTTEFAGQPGYPVNPGFSFESVNIFSGWRLNLGFELTSRTLNKGIVSDNDLQQDLKASQKTLFFEAGYAFSEPSAKQPNGYAVDVVVKQIDKSFLESDETTKTRLNPNPTRSLTIFPTRVLGLAFDYQRLFDFSNYLSGRLVYLTKISSPYTNKFSSYGFEVSYKRELSDWLSAHASAYAYFSSASYNHDRVSGQESTRLMGIKLGIGAWFGTASQD